MSPVRQSVHRSVRPPAHMVDHQYHGPATVPPTPPLQYQPSASVPQVDRMYVPTLPTGQPLARHQTGPPDPDRPPSVRTAGPAGPPQPDRQQAGMLLTTGPYDGVIPANSAQYGDHSAPLQQHQVYSNSAPPQIQTDEYASVSSVDRPVPLNPSTSYGAFGAGFPAYGAQGPASKCDVRSDRPVYSLFEQVWELGRLSRLSQLFYRRRPRLFQVLRAGLSESRRRYVCYSAPRTPRSLIKLTPYNGTG